MADIKYIIYTLKEKSWIFKEAEKTEIILFQAQTFLPL